MDLTLTRKQRRSDGIFSELRDDNGNLIADTLEHSYVDGETFAAKIPNGTYVCQRGQHLLHGMTTPFETFEITGVKDHFDLLFHWGNYNKDSEGCVLVGQNIAAFGPDKQQMITNSKATFEKFMELQCDVNHFTLTVGDA